MVKHTYSNDSQAAQQAAVYLSKLIAPTTNLFFSGGSSADVLVELDSLLSKEQKQSTSLFMVDERYGPQGHKDSNEHVLDFDTAGYRGIYLALKDGLDLAQTAGNYADLLTNVFKEEDSVNLAILGIGSDDHIAGIKAMDQEQYDLIFNDKLYAGYQWEDFDRVTMTPQALLQIDHAVVFAGASKLDAVKRIDSSVAPSDQPSSILTKMPDVQVYCVDN